MVKSQKTRVLVVMGGHSREREVSLQSGKDCANGLLEAGYEVERLVLEDTYDVLCSRLLARDAQGNGVAAVGGVDCVFIALHGGFGEDGHVQALLDLLKVPYTHSGHRAQALAMHKPSSLALFREAKLPTPEGICIPVGQPLREPAFGKPFVVKPAAEGSSIGVEIYRDGDNRSLASGPVSQAMLIERFVPGRELTVAVLGDQALGVTEIRSVSGFYDYEAKYTAGGSFHDCPAQIPCSIRDRCMQIALTAHNLLGCRGVSRADFRWDDDPGHDPILLEVNGVPGMTAKSLVPEQALAAGISFPELVSWMVEQAVCDT